MVLPNIIVKSNKILASQSSNGSSFCCVQDEDEDIFYFSCYQDNLKHVKCVYALINQLICITNNECLILHHKAFHTDFISRRTNSSTARILVLRE